MTGGPAAPTRGSVGDRLRAARRERFVGRRGELGLFRTLLTAPDRDVAVLYLSGPAGIGKSSLLAELDDLAGDLDWESTLLDARTVGLSPAAFRASFVAAGGEPGPVDGLASASDRRVVFIDNYDELAPLDGWVRESVVPALPTGVLVVFASRQPPAAPWRTDAVAAVTRVVSLRNLSPAEVADYVRVAGLAAELDDRVQAITHGHPLALALVVDELLRGPPDRVEELLARLDASPDVVALLVDRFVAQVPSERARRALEVCAHNRLTTESLLRRVLEEDDIQPEFAWLRSLSFIESGRFGLSPHDLARDALDADLRWRDKERYRDLHRRARDECVERVRRSPGADRRQACADLVFLHRSNPRVAPYLHWPSVGDAYADDLSDADVSVILAMAERHESTETARLVAHWLQRQPEAFTIFRRDSRTPIGFLAMLDLQRATATDRDTDPGTRAMWAYATREAPPAAHDAVMAFRFFMDDAVYQGPSASFSLMGIRCVEHILLTPNLAWDFGVIADPEPVESFFADLDYHRAVGADFEVGGRPQAVFAHDFRVVPAERWLDIVGERELADDPPGGGSSNLSLGALSQAEFAAAVRDVLRNIHRPERLTRSPLLATRLASERGGAQGSPAVLVELVCEALDSMSVDPRMEKYRRAVDRTYVRPAPTQEAAAELLGLPFSTYRRQVRRGIDEIVERLWHRELHG